MRSVRETCHLRSPTDNKRKEPNRRDAKENNTRGAAFVKARGVRGVRGEASEEAKRTHEVAEFRKMSEVPVASVAPEASGEIQPSAERDKIPLPQFGSCAPELNV